MTEQLPIILPLAIGAIFYMTGYHIGKNPPKNKNAIYGYKTPASMKSKERWDYAQKISAGKIKSAAIMMMLVAVPMYFFDQGENMNILVSSGLIVFITFIPIFQTEAALSEKFGED